MNMFSCPKEPNNNKIMFMNNTSTSSSNYNNNNNNNINNNNNNEEFSFPVISNNNPLSNFMLSSSSASSSSLWRISSRVYHHQEDQYEEEEENGDYYYYDHREVRSMSEEILPSRRESILCASFQSKDLEVEESMDYLWEDFNEEEKNEVNLTRKNNYGEDLSVSQVATKMSRKHSSCSSSSRRSSSKMLMLGKLLKGLVSIRRSSHHQHKFLKTRY